MVRDRPDGILIVTGTTINVLGLAGIIMSVLAVRRSRQAPRVIRRMSWALLAAFVTLTPAGMAVGASVQAGHGRLAPVLVACVLHLISALAMLMAIFSFPGPRRTGKEWVTLCLDLSTVIGLGALACWYFIIGPALQQDDRTSPEIVLGVSLPVQDLITACGALMALLRGVTHGRRTLAHLIVGYLCVMVPDMHLAYDLAHSSGGVIALPLAVGLTYVAGMSLLTLAAWEHLVTSDTPTVQVNSEPMPGVSYLPYLAVLGGFALLVIALVTYGTYPWIGLVPGTMVMTGGMTLRQMLAIRDNQRLATTDAMTGVANRISITHALERALERVQRTGVPAAVLLFDLNGFKEVNDTYGHDSGDALLTAFAVLLRRNVLGSDTVGRLGGDEFAVILPSVQVPDDARVVAERILADLVEPVVFKGRFLTIRASIGISPIYADDESPASALHRADIAMYEAKRRGRQEQTSAWELYPEPTGSVLRG